MPVYVYQCENCERVVEYKREVADRDAPALCPDCYATCRRVYVPLRVDMNGNGAAQMADPSTLYQFRYLDEKCRCGEDPQFKPQKQAY